VIKSSSPAKDVFKTGASNPNFSKIYFVSGFGSPCLAGVAGRPILFSKYDNEIAEQIESESGIICPHVYKAI
jgi:hypothetical protein